MTVQAATTQQLCAGHSVRTGLPCRKPPIKGAKVCRTHGGSAPQVRAAAAARVVAAQAQADAAAVLAHIGVVGVEDPLEELSLLAREAREFQAALARRVNAANGVQHKSGELRAELALYERATDRCGRFLALLVNAEFEKRRALFQERQVAALQAGLTFLAGEVGLTPEQRARWEGSLRPMFELIKASEAALATVPVGVPTIEGETG